MWKTVFSHSPKTCVGQVNWPQVSVTVSLRWPSNRLVKEIR